MAASLDATDHKILELLQQDARMTNAAIAAKVGLTGPSVFERIRKLEQRGVIQGYTVRVDAAALGRPMTAFIRITAAYDDRYAAGVKAIIGDPDVLECYNVAGEDCFILKTKCSTPRDLEDLLVRIRNRMTVLNSVTSIALSALKEDGSLRAAAADRGDGRLRRESKRKR
ncbi:MAG TPA: Lrp/AsnC family transcriptional regulator [Anaerolineales bacterium]|nr:Lrp/AsnC family transcriptional regulator [Anaerolineales bacterium]